MRQSVPKSEISKLRDLGYAHTTDLSLGFALLMEIFAVTLAEGNRCGVKIESCIVPRLIKGDKYGLLHEKC